MDVAPPLRPVRRSLSKRMREQGEETRGLPDAPGWIYIGTPSARAGARNGANGGRHSQAGVNGSQG